MLILVTNHIGTDDIQFFNYPLKSVNQTMAVSCFRRSQYKKETLFFKPINVIGVGRYNKDAPKKRTILRYICFIYTDTKVKAQSTR